jgi:tetratricopeptide (TPR) repeat protein
MRSSVIYIAVLSAALTAFTPAMAATPVAAPGKMSAADEALPKQALTNQILYQFLVAEIAAQRGDFPLASEAYLDLAKITRDPRIAKRATEVALYARQAGAAESAAKLWLELEPQSSRARQAAASILLGGGKLADAKPYLQQLLTANPANAGAEFLHLGEMLGHQPDKAAGLALVQELAVPYPNLPEAHLVIAQAAARAGKFDMALAELDKLNKLQPNWEAAALLRLEILSRDGKPDGMIYAQDYLKRYPDAKELRLGYARVLLNQNQLPESREQFRILAKAVPNSPEMQLAVGLISLQLNDLDAAEAAFKAALQLNYVDPGVIRIYLGQVAEAKGHDAEAATWYRGVTDGPQYVNAQIKYAVLLAKQGKLNDARAYLHAVVVDNDDDRVHLIQAEADLLRTAKDDAGVYVLLSDALATRPDSVDLLYDHAMAAERLNHIDVLEKDLRHLLKLQPNHAQALNALGYTLADHNMRLPEAVGLLDQALKLAPGDPFILDSMGWAQYRLGKLTAAAEYLQRAFKARPDPEIAAHLGEVLWVQGKHDEARQLWQTSLSASPQNQALLDVMAKFK